VDLGQQLPSSVAELNAQVPGHRQGIPGRTGVAAVAVDAAKLVQYLRPAKVIPHLRELLE
jgi:hypothetical protein